jgi:sulfatase modifying factor 1
MIKYFVIGLFGILSFISCSEDDLTNPDNGNDDPTINIISPADGESFSEGDTITFAGIGENHAGNALPDSVLIWTSDRDDTIGTGTSFETDSLSVKVHVITLTGIDSKGNTGLDSISININPGSGPDKYIFVTVTSTSGYPMGWEGLAEPVHTVSLDEFHIGKYEVTYVLWLDVMSWALNNGYIFEHEGDKGGGSDSTTVQHPVTRVSWRDCIIWCNAYSEKEGFEPVYYRSPSQTELYKDSSEDLDITNDCVDWNSTGIRLPTESEWEYAARYIDGVNVSPGIEHSGYNLYPDIRDCAWYYDNSGFGTHPVGKLHSNSLGIKDMSGNVSEYCWDRLGIYPNHPENKPLGPDTGNYRIIRGGCWYYNDVACRTARRNYSYPGSVADTNRYSYKGFRLCRSCLVP